MTARRQIPGQLTLPLVPGLSKKSRASLVQRIDVRWQDKAYCAGYLDTDDFYPEDETKRGVRRTSDPKDLCAFCPVVRSCLAAAIVADEHGVWGRTTEDERDAIREELAFGTDVDRALSVVLDGPAALWRAAA
ncbi:WhiB family transcriptional regulator [Kribbella sp. NPDC020789]